MKKTKRFFGLLLTIMMAFSLLSVSAMAAEEDPFTVKDVSFEGEEAEFAVPSLEEEMEVILPDDPGEEDPTQFEVEEDLLFDGSAEDEALQFIEALTDGDSQIAKGSCGADGSDVTYTIYASGKLLISGTGAMKDFSSSNQPWNARIDQITSIVVEEGVTNISSHAFDGCSKVKTVTLPITANSVGSYAFRECSSLKSIVLPYAIETLGSYSFQNCRNLAKVTLPGGLKKIYSYAFSNCSALKHIKLPEYLQRIDLYAFERTTLESIVIPKSVTYIGMNAFNNCSQLKKIVFAGDVPETLERSAFNGVQATAYYPGGTVWEEYLEKHGDDLASLTFVVGGVCGDDLTWTIEGKTNKALNITGTGPMWDFDSLTEEPWYNFSDIITSVYTQEGITSIGKNAFYFCEKLEYAYLNGNLTSIGNYAFGCCTALKQIAFYSSAPTFGPRVFYEAGSSVLAYFPAGDPSWTEEVRQEYGGSITWKPTYVKAEIVTQPEDVTVKEGTTASFKVTADIAVFYQWYYQKPGEDTWNKVKTGGTSAKYTLTAKTQYNGYKYRCMVTNWNDNVEPAYSNAVTLKVLTDISSSTISTISNKTYTGKAIKPAVTVTLDSRKLTKGTDYKVTYSNNTNVGTATVKVTGINDYTGTVKKTFKINPKGTTLGTLTPASKAIAVRWTKQATKMSSSRITGYQIQLATDSKFTKNKKTVTVAGYSKVYKKVTNLYGGKKYYVRIRTYKTISEKKYYSSWSKAKTVTTKK